MMERVVEVSAIEETAREANGEFVGALEKAWSEHRKVMVEQVGRLIVVLWVVAVLTAAIVFGTVWWARKTLDRNTRMMQDLHRQVDTNAQVIRTLNEERGLQEKGYDALLQAFETLRSAVERREQSRR